MIESQCDRLIAEMIDNKSDRLIVEMIDNKCDRPMGEMIESQCDLTSSVSKEHWVTRSIRENPSLRNWVIEQQVGQTVTTKVTRNY